MEYSDFQEQLCALYLRLNGYFVSGFIVHAAEGELNDRGEPRKNKSEIDLLAIRFPYNAEPEREVGCSQFLMTCADRIDIVIGEVKGSEAPLKFNDGLRKSRKAIETVLQWIGVFSAAEMEAAVEKVCDILSTHPIETNEAFRECLWDKGIRIRAVLFAPDRPPPKNGQRRFVHGEEIINYIWSCFRPDKPRDACKVRYDFGLWGQYEDLVRFFKSVEAKPLSVKDIYEGVAKRSEC